MELFLYFAHALVEDCFEHFALRVVESVNFAEKPFGWSRIDGALTDHNTWESGQFCVRIFVLRQRNAAQTLQRFWWVHVGKRQDPAWTFFSLYDRVEKQLTWLFLWLARVALKMQHVRWVHGVRISANYRFEIFALLEASWCRPHKMRENIGDEGVKSEATLRHSSTAFQRTRIMQCTPALALTQLNASLASPVIESDFRQNTRDRMPIVSWCSSLLQWLKKIPARREKNPWHLH